ncbi:hypothetical protein OIU79_006400 [Salix purpurea]|uniref:Uncharacterized protein n=1 Tax=Salix purpurea TaxID=77065 RepID=A0A9Q0TVD3_SALPP|nr:hypothetical protein OIU79_006400 [Salix purpurea]
MTRMEVVGRMMRDHPSDRAGILVWFTDPLTCRSFSLSLSLKPNSLLKEGYHAFGLSFFSSVSSCCVILRIKCFIW